MAPHGEPLRAHSVAEAYLYLMIARCPSCGRGPLEQTADLTRAADGGWTLPARCVACTRAHELTFSIQPEPTRAEAESNAINPTAESSRVIDLLGWLTVYRTLLGGLSRAKDKDETRRLALEAAQCLDEALKFYDGDNDLPRADAFFDEDSRRRFHDHPEHFSKLRWLHERSKLPGLKSALPPVKKRRWWQRERRSE